MHFADKYMYAYDNTSIHSSARDIISDVAYAPASQLQTFVYAPASQLQTLPEALNCAPVKTATAQPVIGGRIGWFQFVISRT